MPLPTGPDTTRPTSASRRAVALLRPADDRAAAGRRAAELTEEGFLDLLGERDPTGSHPGQRLMLSNMLPRIYERLWRPLGAHVLMGPGGPGTREEHRIALEMLDLSPGDTVLDLACGPGNFTRDFARAVGDTQSAGDSPPVGDGPVVSDGLVVGVDASRTMLARAARETGAANVAYVRGDACALPFRDGSFSAICCFAALYLIDEPMRALDEIARLLAPGGRLALLSSCNRGPLPAALTSAVVRGLIGVRIFARDELTGALRDRGLTDVEQRVTGLAQFVSARRPAPVA